MTAVLLAAPVAPPAAAQSANAPLAGFEEYVARAVKDWGVPGLAVAVVKDDSTVFARGYGVRTIGTHDTVDTHTLFALGSTTKAFTTMALAMMVDAGKVRWDDAVTAYLPGFVLRDPYVSREVTLRDLLTHELGFGDPDYMWYGSDQPLAEMIRRLRYLPPETSFRSHFAYNNIGYAVAGQIAGTVNHSSWDDLVRTRILGPLGMSETVMEGPDLRGKANVTRPHQAVDDTLRALPASSQQLVDAIAPAGSMYSNVLDMAKWLRFLLDSGRVEKKRLVSDTAFAELMTPQVLVGRQEFYPTAKLTNPNFIAYGLAWFLEDYRGEKVVFHTGSIDGLVAIVGLIPARRLGVVVLANRDHAEVRHALMYRVFDSYLGAPHRDWSADMRAMYQKIQDSVKVAKKEADAKRVKDTKPSLALAGYAGTYADSLYGSVTVRLERGGLVLAPSQFLTADLEHWNYDTFRARYRNRWLGTSLVTFRLAPDGKVSAIDLDHGQILARVAPPKAASSGAH
ncbi:MAG TPA: serine hydrolase [Gemmatimonadales bacterium]|jgi:CubicO group peptidase (beta-lactamase class C family)|nr:serine hydrolase [Gemmatimonadales bacterium]